MILDVFVKTNSKRNSIEFKDNIYTVCTSTPARENKANLAVISLLSDYLNIPKSKITIIKGLKSRKKKFKINVL